MCSVRKLPPSGGVGSAPLPGRTSRVYVPSAAAAPAASAHSKTPRMIAVLSCVLPWAAHVEERRELDAMASGHSPHVVDLFDRDVPTTRRETFITIFHGEEHPFEQATVRNPTVDEAEHLGHER